MGGEIALGGVEPDAILVPLAQINVHPEAFAGAIADAGGAFVRPDGLVEIAWRAECGLCRQVEPCRCSPGPCRCTCGGCALPG